MIAYYFPPIGGSGSLRPLKLAKYLPLFGWRPVILTVKNPDWYYADDPDLLTELPDEARVVRSRMIRSAWLYRVLNPLRWGRMDRIIRRFLVHPDDQIGWLPFAYSSVMGLIRRLDIDAVYSTSSPMTCHLIGYLVKKHTNIPWVADFRDEWFENPDFDFPSNFHRRMHYRLEKMVVDSADHIITAAPGFCRLLEKHPGCAQKSTTIYMGYDPDDFDNVKATPAAQRAGHTGPPFTIAFSGLFYASFRPAGIISAAQKLIEAGKIDPGSIRILFIGANTPDETGFFDKYGICRFTGFVSHKQALAHLRKSDTALLLLSRARGNFVVPSKTFEYIASGKPILAAVPKDGEVASIIRRTNTGVVVDFDDEKGLSDTLLRLYRDWSENSLQFSRDENEIAYFNQKHQAARFAGILDKMLTGESDLRK